MKISLKWLRELCPVSLDDDEIAHKLTGIGLEVEGREQRSIGPGVVAARVVTRKPVEGSDHLSLCQVDDGAGTHQVVCGAQNYAAGDVVPMARPGAKLPNGMEIRKAKLRGVESEGMLCSQRELGLSDDHAGLMILPRDARIGAPLDELLGLPDTVLEVNVTPNRPDALSHLGIARELSAITGVPVRVPRTQPAGKGELPARVDVEDAQRCPRYVARVIEGVRVGPSPLHVQERLRSCGVRPISNVVDATNLALLELGHPLHGFDLEKLAGRRIVVRRAREGEPLTTLDGKERKLSADDLVIADAEKPVALAGVMGGQTSEVGQGTTRILLESAMFEPAGVRRTAKRQALHTEASHRFERGMDERIAQAAADRCAELIVQLAGGKLLAGTIDVYPSPREPAKVMVRPGRVSAVLGMAVSEAEVDRWLRALQLVPVGDGRWSVPSWRRDLTREIDCIEEIARLRGYDTIPVNLHRAGIGETAAIAPQRRVTGQARAALSAHGFDEALNYSFIAEKDLLAVSAAKPLRVANPLTTEQGAMRTTLLAGLLRNTGWNLARGVRDVKLYELGRVYLPEPDARHPAGELAWPLHEPRRLGLVVAGARRAKGWSGGGEATDFYDLKGAVEDVLEALGIGDARFQLATHPALHPASASALLIGGTLAGALGQVHPAAAAQFEVPAETYLAELDWELLLDRSLALKHLRGVPRFPAVARDLAFVVDAAVPAEKLLEEIRAADSARLLEHVALFDVYRGAPIPEGRKSMAFGLSLRAPDRTLTDAEADALCNAIRDRLKQRVGAEIRA
ncbi:MAG TPA: phenylalanine--tRNA ligase subunit beta [Myxococcales bacterium]|jgi:phenylalanyl-tRNA synthetase beta chain|nr:phenylalanine--tRNA ligase subunit beta [Myxococcales bacterium]